MVFDLLLLIISLAIIAWSESNIDNAPITYWHI
jgi:hypothetical protein